MIIWIDNEKRGTMECLKGEGNREGSDDLVTSEGTVLGHNLLLLPQCTSLLPYKNKRKGKQRVPGHNGKG